MIVHFQYNMLYLPLTIEGDDDHYVFAVNKYRIGYFLIFLETYIAARLKNRSIKIFQKYSMNNLLIYDFFLLHLKNTVLLQLEYTDSNTKVL